MTEPHWRHAQQSDLPQIGEIAARIHPDLPERTEVISEKMRLCPDGCLVLAARDAIVGYGLSHPWMQHQIPPLDGFLEKLPPNTDCLYVHDVAVLPDYRGGGTARTYVATIEVLARSSHIETLTLVSVYRTRSLWERFGFRVVASDAALRRKLESYGESATFMVRDLGDSHGSAP
jgi:ribosomal protein S18 acetylase RimI-like enzyme